MGGSVSKRDGDADRSLGYHATPSPRAPLTPTLGPSVSHASPTLPAASAAKASDVIAELEHSSLVPTVFRWEHGGNHVYITGTFNNWSKRVPMHRSGNDFLYIAGLPRGKHAFKFIVDDDWRFAPDQATISDLSGNINNYIDLTNFIVEDDTIAVQSAAARRDSLPGVPYGHTMPDDDEFSKDPPLLPPHLRSITLNSDSPVVSDPMALPTPTHVTVHHLYCTAIKDGLMVQAVTQRYRRKFFTTVYYSVMPVSTTLSQPGGSSNVGEALGLSAVEILASRVALAEAAAMAATAAAGVTQAAPTDTPPESTNSGDISMT